MTPKYKQVKKAIKSRILEGNVQPNERIRSENELADTFGVSRHTIRQAIGELVHEGWVYRQQGRGTFCADLNNRIHPQKREKTIGMLVSYISDYIFPSIVRGAESYLSSRGYSILLVSTDNDVEQEEESLQNILGKKISGLIVQPTKSAFYTPNINYYLTLQQHGIPYVMLNAYYEELSAPHLILDDELGGYLAAEHLLELGHRRIAGFFKTDDMMGVKRLKGFFRAHEEYGETVHPGMVVTIDSKNERTRPSREIRKMLEKSGEEPTAVFCYNDQIALDILDVLREKEIRVPEDLSIVGFDDSHLAQASEVKLTSIKHPKKKMGEDAAKLLIDFIEGRSDPAAVSPPVYEPELIVRNSTCSLTEATEAHSVT